MNAKAYSDELQRALARPDAAKLCRQIDAYAAYYENGKEGEWPDEYADDFGEIIDSGIIDGRDYDPKKALAYVILAAARSDNPGFIGLMACSALEDILHEPSQDMLERIVAEARKSARFRWMLNHPYKAAISNVAWNAIERFRITGPHEEPPNDTMPSRN